LKEGSEPLLTPKQKNLLDFIEEYSNEKGYAPSFREMAAHFGLSVSTVSSHVHALRKKEQLQLKKQTSRSLKLKKEDDKHPPLPIEGVIRAPFKGVVPLAECVSTDRALYDKEVLCYRIEGAMFEEEGIYSGDLLFLQKDKKPKEGDSCLIHIPATGDLFVKILHWEDETLLLKSCGTGVDTLKIPKEHAEILGVVKSLLRLFD